MAECIQIVFYRFRFSSDRQVGAHYLCASVCFSELGGNSHPSLTLHFNEET